MARPRDNADDTETASGCGACDKSSDHIEHNLINLDEHIVINIYQYDRAIDDHHAACAWKSGGFHNLNDRAISDNDQHHKSHESFDDFYHAAGALKCFVDRGAS